MPSARHFSNEQLQLIFELHGDIAKQNFREEQMDRKLADLLDSLSGQTSYNACLVFHRQCACTSIGKLPPRGEEGRGQF